MIDLPNGIGLSRFSPVDQIEALTVGLIASMGQHKQSRWKATYNPANDRIAWSALLESFCHAARLPVYGTALERGPLLCKTLNRLYQMRRC
jgi:hypothetical protein